MNNLSPSHFPKICIYSSLLMEQAIKRSVGTTTSSATTQNACRKYLFATGTVTARTEQTNRIAVKFLNFQKKKLLILPPPPPFNSLLFGTMT